MEILCLPRSSLLRIESLPRFHQTATVYDQEAQGGGGSSWIWVSTAGRLTVPHGNVRDSPRVVIKWLTKAASGGKAYLGSAWGTEMWGCWSHYFRSGSREINMGDQLTFSFTGSLGPQPMEWNHSHFRRIFSPWLPYLETLSQTVVCILGDHHWQQCFIVSSEAWFCWFCHGEISTCASWGTPKFGLNTQYYAMPFHLHVYVKEGLIKSGELMLGQI